MRHLTKRLLSGLLALIMLYGCVGTVFAASQNRNYGNGHATGTSSNEGVVKEGRINVVLPTVEADFFNFLLDPQGVIAKTNAGDHPGVVDYDEGKLYFRNKEIDPEAKAGSGIAFYHNSDPLTVINKGTVPVNVKLSVLANKGSYTFAFADLPDFKDENGAAIEGNAMSLTAVSGRRFASVREVTSITSGGEEIAGDANAAVLDVWVDAVQGLHNVEWDRARGFYKYVPKPDVPDSTFENFSFFVSGQIQGTDWSESAQAEGAIALSLVWDITESEYEEFSYEAYPDPDVPPSTKPKTHTCTTGEKVILLVDLGCGDDDSRPMRSIDKITYQKRDGSTATIGPSALKVENLPAETTRITFNAPAAYTKRVTFTAPADMIPSSNWKLHFTDKAGTSVEAPFDPRTLEPVAQVSRKAHLAGDTVVLDVHYGLEDTRYPDVYRIVYTGKEGGPSNFTPVVKSNGSAVTFAPNLPLLQGSDWKLVLYKDADEDGAYTDEEATYELNLDSFFTPSETARDPSAIVRRIASEAGDSVALSVDYGAGLGWYPNVDKIIFTKADGSDGEIDKNAITVSGADVTFTATEDVINGSGWKLQLSNRTEDIIQIPVNIFTTATPTPTLSPTPTSASRPFSIYEINPKATQAGDTVAIPVDWGAGDGRMVSIAEVQYKTPDNKDASISSETYLYASGTNVMLKFTSTSIKGHDFVLVLRDAKGQFHQYPIDPIETYTPTVTPTPLTTSTPTPTDTPTPTPTPAYRDASVTVTQKATTSTGTATITVDWGTGDGRAVSVKEMQYTNASGKQASVTSTTYLKTSGNTITFKFTSTTFKGTNFVLVLRNAKGASLQFPVDIKG